MRTSQRAQQGAALIVSLVLLAVVALMAGTAAIDAQNQESVSQAQRNRAASFNVAQTALARAENWLQSQNQEPETQSTSSCTHPCVLADNAISNWSVTDPDDWEKHTGEVGNVDFSGSNQRQGYYFIELNDYDRDTSVYGQKQDERHQTLYRIYAYGVGPSGNQPVIVTSSYAQRYR